MVKVVGIDPSLTGAGFCYIKGGDCETEVWTHVFKTATDDGSLGDRYARIQKISEPIIDLSYDASLIVIEGPSYGSQGQYTWDRAGLWWSIVGLFCMLHMPIVAVSPKTRAKWATGNGNSAKSAVAVSMGRMWPSVTLKDDNDSDALALAHMGAQYMNFDVPAKPWQAKEVEKVQWGN